MTQNYSILFDLDGTLVDTAPDLMNAHNHVMKKYGYPTKSTADIRNLVGQGAGAMIGRSIWGQAKKEFGKIDDQKIKAEMVKDFVKFYGKNINTDKIKIVKKNKPTSFPEKISTPLGEITVFKPNFETKWQVQI